jgi:hypothetical protein
LCSYDRIYGPEPPTPADLKREADHEKLVRVFPVVGETIEPNKTYAGAKSRRRFRISNIDSADPLPSFAAPSTQTEPDLSSEIGAIAGGQKRRGYGGELRECSDTDPWLKRAKPILIDLDPVEFADFNRSRHQIIKA